MVAFEVESNVLVILVVEVGCFPQQVLVHLRAIAFTKTEIARGRGIIVTDHAVQLMRKFRLYKEPSAVLWLIVHGCVEGCAEFEELLFAQLYIQWSN